MSADIQREIDDAKLEERRRRTAERDLPLLEDYDDGFGLPWEEAA
ncbi:hypothetical protein [Streptomyces californicus]|nr:hypothetical protein [Streptomyces californicus]